MAKAIAAGVVMAVYTVVAVRVGEAKAEGVMVAAEVEVVVAAMGVVMAQEGRARAVVAAMDQVWALCTIARESSPLP